MAYDKVSTGILWRHLEPKDIPMVYVTMIKDIYDRTKTWVRIVGGDLEHFLIEIELHQGSMLTPFVIVLVMDE